MKKFESVWFERETAKGYSKEDVDGSLVWFRQNKERLEERDLLKWDAKELEEEIKKLGESNRQKRKDAKDGAIKIFDGKEYDVYAIETFDACVHYGAHTKWCITGESHWNSYKENSNYFFFFIRKEPQTCALDKVAMQINRLKKVDGKPEVKFFDSADIEIKCPIKTDKTGEFLSSEGSYLEDGIQQLIDFGRVSNAEVNQPS